MKKLKMTSLYNNIHFYIIPLILIILSFHYIIFIILLIIYLIYIYKKRIAFKFILITSIIFASYYGFMDNYEDTSESFSGMILTREINESNNKYIIFNGFTKVIVYSESTFKVGDVIKGSGNLLRLQEESYDGGFSYKDYLKSQKIYKVISEESIKKTRHIISVYSLRDNLENYFNTHYDTKDAQYILAFLLSINEIDSTSRENINKIGISHLFCISGYHVNLLYMAISFILSKFIKSEDKKDNIVILFLIFYIFLCGFTISVFRAFLMLIIALIVKKFNLLFTKLDILSLSLFPVLIINPLWLNQISGILTYILAFFLIINGRYSKDKIKSSFKTSILCFFASLPLIVNMNNEINLLSILYTPLFMVLIGYIVIPYTYLIIILPNFNVKVISLLELVINKLANIEVFIFKIPNLNIYFIIVYYILFFWILINNELKLKQTKLILTLFIYCVFLKNLNVVRFYDEITMINVGQGDSILISLSHNRGNMLIDSYGYNLEFLKDYGIDKLDYLVLTHPDEDHIKTATDVIDSIKVKNVVSSPYSGLSYVNKTIQSGDTLYLDNIKLDCLGPVRYSDNTNNISVVLKLTINNLSILFTGDMEEEEELDLINKYNYKLSSDIIKIGHHGSSTSTSEEFLKYVNPSIALISVGEDNKFGHPSSDVLNRLKMIKVYRTDINKNISIRIYKDNFKIKPYK